MKLFIKVILYLLLSVVIDVSATSIKQLMDEGKIDEVRDSLSARSTAAMRDGNTLYWQALIESDAHQSARLLRAALNASVDFDHQEDIYYRLAQYYFLEGDKEALTKLILDYRSRWEKGRHESEISRYAVALDEAQGHLETALRQVDKYLLTNSVGDRYQWGMVDKARVMIANKKRIGAVQMLRELSRGKYGPGVPQALYLLAQDAIEHKRADDAVFYYSLLKESYPMAVGVESLVDQIATMSTKVDYDNTAEKLTGTYYSVQVGVFSESGNAKRQADAFKKYDRKVIIGKKRIGDTTYHVVYVGRFDNYPEALTFKEKLEATHDESFRVVAR